LFKLKTREIFVGSATQALIVGGVEIAFIDIDKDLAILLLPASERYVRPLDYEYSWTYIGLSFGMTTEEVKYAIDHTIKVGDAVAVLVATRDEEQDRTWQYEVRTGVIESTRADGCDIEALPWFSVNDVTMSTMVYPGDSGSPVFAFIDGRPVLVGIARATYADGYGVYHSYFTRIDILTRFLITGDN
jgi:hypothetical protein